MLAHPGPPLPFAVGANDVIRGRVRYHLDADGALRLRDVLAETTAQAIPLPPVFGGGVALVAEQGVAIASSSLRPIVRASLSAITVGARELWARERATSDWVRIDVLGGRATRELSPIAAPILTTWSTMGATAGRPNAVGPEFATPTFAVAILDLLGPVLTRDAGQTWSPIDSATLRGAFPLNLPARVLRDGTTLLLVSEDRTVPVLSSGALGAPLTSLTTNTVPDSAALRLELVAPFGVPLPSGALLVADGPRLGVVELDPVRVSQVVRAPEYTRCEIAPSHTDLAIAACVRHHEGLGAQLAIGAVGGDLRLSIERTFAFGTDHRISVSSATVVAATCAGTSEGGIDLLNATKYCVRDRDGHFGDLAIPALLGRRRVIGLASGGLAVLREDASGRGEISVFSRASVASSVPLRLRLDAPPRDVIAFDETAPGRLQVWRRSPIDLRSFTIDVGEKKLHVANEARTVLQSNAIIGTHGDHAMIAAMTPTNKVEASITTDGGRTWSMRAWPEDVRPLDGGVSGRRVECGAAGCRLFGWTRIGWQPIVTSHDRVVTFEDAPPLAAMPTPVTRARTIVATCHSLSAAQPVAATVVPIASPAYPQQANDVLLGLPPPKVPKDFVQVLTPFSGRQVRGGFVNVGPTIGVWTDKARAAIRFASDFDPLGTVHESATFNSPFPDRVAAQLSWGTLRQVDAFPLGPGRILSVVCFLSKCEVHRVTANAPPQKIDIPGLALARFINARELGDTLAILATGARPEASGRMSDAMPFIALIDPHGTTVSFFARSDDTRLTLTVDRTRGVFAIRSSTPVPSWTDGTSYVLPLGIDGRPAGAFEKLIAPSVEISRPTSACGVSAPGWDEADIAQARTLSLRIDGAEPILLPALGGAIRSRLSSSSVCIDRLTALSRAASFQLDPATGRATYYALDAAGKTGKRSELACTIDWAP